MSIAGGTSVMRDPHEIYQEWLDTSSAALMDGDASGFVAGISLPFVMRTVAGATVLETEADLLHDAGNVIEALRSQNVTDFIRLVKQAHYLDEDTIEGWHTTYALRHATNVVPPFGSRVILRQIDGAWLMTEADYELAGDRIPQKLLSSVPGAFEDAWKAAKSDLRATHARAEPIYQVFIDSLCGALKRRDFEGWSAHFSMPHSMHFESTDLLVETPDDISPIFDLMVANMDAIGATRVRCQSKFAEFLSGDRIIGYHETTCDNDGTTRFGPIHGRMQLCQEGGRWVCCSSTSSLSKTDDPEARLLLSDVLPSMREIQKRMKT